MWTKLPVLDKGFVQLVDHMGSDLSVVNAARVSFDKESEAVGKNEQGVPILSQKDLKLIQYLSNHNHWTPFAHPQISLRVKAPIFVRTQMFKHKQGLVENEVSRRYVDEEPEFYEPDVWRGRPDGSVKQGSGNSVVESPVHWDAYRNIYVRLLDSGVAPEMARMVLPQSTYTTWIWTGSLAAFARVYNQRSDPHAQWEAQEYARAISEIIQPLFPVSWAALTQGGE